MCPHCGHEWAKHQTRYGDTRCTECGCRWTEPKPPTPPPTERDLLVQRIARLLYEGVRETCDGYVEGYEQYGDTDPSEEVIDGRVDFPLFAAHVIASLGLDQTRRVWVVTGTEDDGTDSGYRYITRVVDSAEKAPNDGWHNVESFEVE